MLYILCVCECSVCIGSVSSPWASEDPLARAAHVLSMVSKEVMWWWSWTCACLLRYGLVEGGDSAF